MAYMKPIHPGKVLRKEYLQPLGLSANALAVAMNIPSQRIHEILHEQRAISPDTALRLGRYLRTPPIYWLQLQAQHDLHKAELETGGKITKEVKARDDQGYVEGKRRKNSGITDREKNSENQKK